MLHNRSALHLLAIGAAALAAPSSFSLPNSDLAPASPAVSGWSTLASVPTGPLHEHSIVVLSPTKLAIIGGVLQAPTVLNTVYIYDIPSNTWTKAVNFPVAINHANAAVVDGKLYVLGGMIGAGWVGTEKSWVYDLAADKWTAVPSMPASEARGSAAMGVYNKTIWLASGKTGSGGKSLTTVSAFDSITQKWLTIPEPAKNIPEGRDHGGGVIIGTRFYQLGGSLQEIANRKDTVFVLDLENLSKGWITAKGRMPTPRRGIAVAAIETKIFTFGGEGNPDPASKGVFKEVEVYDTVTDSWEKLGPMEIPRHGTYAAEVDGKIYILGGGTATGTPCTAAFDVYTP
jgi:N-acetylneuraminic acid mutarotase